MESPDDDRVDQKQIEKGEDYTRTRTRTLSHTADYLSNRSLTPWRAFENSRTGRQCKGSVLAFATQSKDEQEAKPCVSVLGYHVIVESGLL